MSTGERTTDDRAAAIATLTAQLNAGLAEDEETAKAAMDTGGSGAWQPGHRAEMTSGDQFIAFDSREVRAAAADEDAIRHIARNDPASTLRRVRAGQDLLAAILGERHDYNPSDEYYSCSQAVGEDPDPNVSLARGSGCSDPGRAGQPCDCGRDARVERLLRILAGVYEEGGR